MATKYLDDTGLAYLWSKLKAYFQPKLSTTSSTYNNMTVYRYGNVRMVYVNAVSGQTVGQLNAGDRPPVACRSVGTVYNGTSYVTAILGVDTSGNVTIQGQFGGAISGIQIGFMAPRFIMFIV